MPRIGFNWTNRLILICCLLGNFQAFSKPTTVVVKESIRSVVTLKCFDSKDREFKSGSGFIISNDGYLVTNWHVIEGVARVEAVAYNGGIFKEVLLSTFDKSIDIAILKLSGNSLDTIAINSKTPELGSKIIVVGSPLGLDKTVSEGIISGFRVQDSVDLIQMSAPISPGSSGGPALDRFGKVIGIVRSTIKDAQAINFVIPSKYIEKVFKRSAKLTELSESLSKNDDSGVPKKTAYPRADLSGVYSIKYDIICKETFTQTGIMVLSSHENGLLVLSGDINDKNDRRVFVLDKVLLSKEGNVLLDFGLPFDGYQTDEGFIAASKFNSSQNLDCTNGILSGTRMIFPLSDPHGVYEIEARTSYFYNGDESSDQLDWYGNASVLFAKDSIFVDLFIKNNSGGSTNAVFKGDVLSDYSFKLVNFSKDKFLSGNIINGSLIGVWVDLREKAYFKGQITGNRK